jgi:MinD-like ATPase involved in chromosome partitioning or flagellar assembly
VGKSVIAFNLAERATAMGLRTLLVDADLMCGNQHILANINAADLTESVVAVNEHLAVLARATAGPIELLTTASQLAQFAARLREQARSYDLVMIDHSSGISQSAAVFASASDVNLMVMIPELTSISDCYGLCKYLYQSNRVIDCRLLLNRVESDGESEYIWSRFSAVAEQFLGRVPGLAGALREEPAMRRSVAVQKPLAAIAPESSVLQSLESVLRQLSPNLQPATRAGRSQNINNVAAAADIRE